jgi:hypothetical protein
MIGAASDPIGEWEIKDMANFAPPTIMLGEESDWGYRRSGSIPGQMHESLAYAAESGAAPLSFASGPFC